jgi:hypothetical protein
VDHLGLGQRLVVLTHRSLRRGGEDGLEEGRVLPHVRWKVQAVGGVRALLEVRQRLPVR